MHFLPLPKRLCFHPCPYCWMVGLSKGLNENYRTDFHITWMEDGYCPKRTFDLSMSQGVRKALSRLHTSGKAHCPPISDSTALYHLKC